MSVFASPHNWDLENPIIGFQHNTQVEQVKLEDLCVRCCQYDFTLSSKDKSVWYGTPFDIYQNQKCVICQMLLYLLPRDTFSEHRGRSRYNKKPGLPNESCKIVKSGPDLAIYYARSIRGWIKAEYSQPRGMIMEDVSSPFDVTMLQQWVQFAREDQQMDFQSNPKNEQKYPIKLSFIDVQDLCIIPGSSREAYIALSYVWGDTSSLRLTKEVRKDLTSKKGLEEHWNELPLTIQDAIHLTTMLGVRYLWIDALCICQNDEEEKAVQLSQMDKVYQLALITFAIIDGIDAESGIPGVRPHSRLRHEALRVFHPTQRITLRTHNPSIGLSMLESTYHRRGWTFQEVLMSNRIIYFTDYQALFCYQGKVLTDGPDPQLSRNGRLTRNYLQNFATLTANAAITAAGFPMDPSVWQFRLYAKLLGMYSKRELGYKNDAINAFLGIIKPLERVCEDKFVCGLPQKHIYRSLLWMPTETNRLIRNEYFSSWSWAGWYGPKGYRNWSTILEDDRYHCYPPSKEKAELPPLQPEMRILDIANSEGIDRLHVETTVLSAAIFSYSLCAPKSNHGGFVIHTYSMNVDAKVRLDSIIAVYDREGKRRCGFLFAYDNMKYDISSSSIIVISQCRYPIPSWFNSLNGHLRKKRSEVTHFPLLFDHDQFGVSDWCLRDVMLVKEANGSFERVTVGQVHVNALEDVSSSTKVCQLA
jgi:hypothetical protein